MKKQLLKSVSILRIIVISLIISLLCVGTMTMTACEEKQIGSLLPNVYAKIKNGQDITVAYFGGSVTEGMGQSVKGKCWRDLSCNWMNENYGVPNGVKFEQKRYGPLGGTGTDLNVYRVNYALMYDTDTPADLLFIEYAINDFYKNLGYDGSAYYLESIIRNVRQNNPTCDIVVCITTDHARADTEYANAKAHADVAAHYGIPVIWIGKQLYADIVAENGGIAPADYKDEVWKKYFLDNVHPIDAGYAKYFEYLRDDILKPNLDDNEEFSLEVKEYTVPKKLFVQNLPKDSQYYGKELLDDAYVVPVENIPKQELEEKARDFILLAQNELYSKSENASIKIKFNSEKGGLFFVKNDVSDTLEYSVDDGEFVEIDLYDYRSIAYDYIILFEEEEASEHIVEIRPGKKGNYCKLKGFFLAGDTENKGIELLNVNE